jgi:hypothetical protein
MNPSLSPELDRIINKVLEKNRDLRYQYAAKMRNDLERLKGDLNSGKATKLRVRRASVRRKILAGAITVLVTVLLASGSWRRFLFV